MDEEREKMSIVNMKEGAAVEMFDLALGKVLENIRDINTTLKPREITLKAAFLPSEDRSLVSISLGVSVKTCGQETQKLTADLLVDKGRTVALERVSRQADLPFGVVKPLTGKGE